MKFTTQCMERGVVSEKELHWELITLPTPGTCTPCSFSPPRIRHTIKFFWNNCHILAVTQEAVAQRSWCSGDNGIVLFNSENAKFDLCVKEDRARTSKELTMKILPAEKGPFEIVDKEANVAWQLAYRVVPLPGIFARTKVVSVMPRYCIANCTDQHLQIKQKDSESVICVEPFTSEGWHKSNAAGSTEVQFKSTATLWSLGTLDINEHRNNRSVAPVCPF